MAGRLTPWAKVVKVDSVEGEGEGDGDSVDGESGGARKPTWKLLG